MTAGLDFDMAVQKVLEGARGPALGHLIEHIGELIAEEDRDDGRRRFVGPEAVVV